MRHLLFALIYVTFITTSTDAAVYKKWETICQNGCRTFTTSEVSIFSDTLPYLVLLEIDSSNQVIVSGLDTEKQHYDFFTNKVAIELKRGARNYVPARTFFNTRFPATLIVDGADALTLHAYDESHFGAAASLELLNAFRRGSTVELVYASGFRGKGQRVSFSLIGFSAAYAARNGLISPESTTAQDPTILVFQHLSGNRYGFRREDLKVRPNPYGEGVFVYIPEVEIAGYKRWFYWFVKGNKVVVLNGATNGLTPKLPYPRDTSYTLWHNTGLSVRDVTERGRDLIFTP